MLRDTFWQEAESRLSGWVFTSASRYDPTVIEGVTPSGRAFTFTLTRDGVATITIAGRTRQQTIDAATITSGAASVTALLEARALLPANQQ